jgi:hypothetical protein
VVTTSTSRTPSTPQPLSGLLLKGSQLSFPPTQQATASQTAAGSGEGSTVPGGMLECSSGKLETMLRHVDMLQPQWHKQVDML